MKKHLTIKGKCAIIYESAGHLGVAQLVARYLGVVEAAGSSPVTQTRKTGIVRFPFFFCFPAKARESLRFRGK